MIKRILYFVFGVVISSGLYANFDASRLSGGLYTEYPVTNGLALKYKLQSDYFFHARYGVAPEFYMEQMGDILSYFDWWKPIYSDLLTELLSGMHGVTIGFGKDNVFGKKGTFVSIGTSFYRLDYNERSNDAFNDVFGTNLPESGRDLIVNGKAVILNFSIGKQFEFKEKWTLDTILSINRIISVYAIAESEFFANNTLSYELSKWLRDNLENMTLPSVSLSLKRSF